MRPNFNVLKQNAEVVSPRLLGCYLIRKIGRQELIGKIVETEAYSQSDAASHSYRGETARTSVMFGPAGHAYVYFTYGMHYCMNVVVGRVGFGEAVLIRALEPIDGLDIMEKNRHAAVGLCNGPAKLCQALKIERDFNGHNLQKSPLRLVIKSSLDQQKIIQTTRIGISRDSHRPWRFYIKDNAFVSRP